MLRRLHVQTVQAGRVPLDLAQSRHATQVLRLDEGTTVEIFDDAGGVATGQLHLSPTEAWVEVAELSSDHPSGEADGRTWRVAAAVPKGERADWMVEKLSELGCDVFQPLLTERGVVAPKGVSKIDRWRRLATESAKQCRRRGVMRIESPLDLQTCLRGEPLQVIRCFGDTGLGAVPLGDLLSTRPAGPLAVYIGPEGGWTAAEMDQLLDARATAVTLTNTILRTETAAVAAGALIACLQERPGR